MIRRSASIIALSALVILVTSCATTSGPDVQQLLAEGKTDSAMLRLQEAAKADSKDPDKRLDLYRQRELFVLRVLAAADAARDGGNYEAAESAYTQVIAVDGANPRARAGLDAIAAARHHQSLIQSAAALQKDGKIDAAKETLRPVLQEDPQNREARNLQKLIDEQQRAKTPGQPTLDAAFSKPITLEFRDANIRTIFEMISRSSGINFVFDKDVRPDIKSTLFVKDSSIAESVKVLLLSNQLAQKVLNDHTVLIYPNIPAKQQDYQDLVVRSFYLSNADAKQTVNMIRTVVKTKDIFVDDKLNMLVVRDTPEAMAMIEKLIQAQDLAEPEVILEMEVLEISTSRLAELGIQYPNKIGLGVVGTDNSAGSAGTNILTQTGGTLSLTQAAHLNSDMIRVTVPDPAILLNLSKSDSDSKLLANPRIRVRNREKAKIHIGERVPVITTTSTANVGISESVNYLDVGLKLDIEPNIYLENEVAMKVSLEVSNIIDSTTSSNGTKTYTLGSRTADTTLRLKDNETQILAGLIQDDDIKSAAKVPLLGDLPILGRLFSSHSANKSKTEIVLLITPHIVRSLSRPDADITEFMSGTASAVGVPRMGLTSLANRHSLPQNQGTVTEQPAPEEAPVMPETPEAVPENGSPGSGEPAPQP